MSSNWLDSYGTSNRFYQSYIQGFVDISGGNLIMRNNSLYLKAGDISLNGNLFVSRDVSLNANVYVKGNVGIGTTNPIGLLDICGSLVRTTILTNGNVGIGTTAPVGLLDICGSSVRTTILTNGNVGIGKTNPTTHLDVNGTTTSVVFNATSDYRIKTNVVSLQDTSITVDNLRPVMYTNILSKKEDIGFIAHEVQEYIPCLVSGEKDGEYHQSINYNGMIGILTKEIQELKNENRSLYERLSLIESKLNIS